MADSDLDATWTVLATEARSRPNSFTMIDSAFAVQAGTIQLAINEIGQRTVLIPVRNRDAFAEDTRGEAVHIKRIVLDGANYLAAVCRRSELDSIFARFSWELLNAIVGTDNPALAATELLDHWRRLLAEAGAVDGMTRSQVVGLFGELLVLRNVLELDPMRDVSVWTGPFPGTGVHDFRRGLTAVEVKTTLSRGTRIVSISSVEQLEPPVSGQLFLEIIELNLDPSGMTLSDLVDEVLALGPDRREIDDRLTASGFSRHRATNRSEERFSVLHRRLYDVDQDGFPKVVSSSFLDGRTPPGVLDLRYSIDLTNEPPRPLLDQSRNDVIRLLASST